MSTCPECSGPALVAETRLLSRGDRRRRWKCKACCYRWTEYNGPRPTTGPPPVRLSDDAIRDIPTSRETKATLAERYQLCKGTVYRIRYGVLHGRVLPEVPRWRAGQPMATAAPAAITGPSCLLCVHFNGKPGNPCGLGHSDPVEEGVGFAEDCSTYLEAE